MAFNIKNEETDRLARELVELTGESLTDAVTIALRERIVRCRRSGAS
jgi:antitoxin VapB